MNRSTNHSGFSLIELLVVVSIIGVLSVVTIATLNTSVTATRLAATSQTVVDTLRLARSKATSLNANVEVRLYQLPDYDKPNGGSAEVYRAVQAVMVSSSKTNAITKLFLFPPRLRISSDATRSSAMKIDRLTGQVQSYANARYVPITFTPNGSVKPIFEKGLTASSEWYFTIEDGAKPEGGGWQDNYATITVNPVTGAASVVQPR